MTEYRIRYTTHGAFENVAYTQDKKHAEKLKEGLLKLKHVTEVNEPEPVEEEHQ